MLRSLGIIGVVALLLMSCGVQKRNPSGFNQGDASKRLASPSNIRSIPNAILLQNFVKKCTDLLFGNQLEEDILFSFISQNVIASHRSDKLFIEIDNDVPLKGVFEAQVSIQKPPSFAAYKDIRGIQSQELPDEHQPDIVLFSVDNPLDQTYKYLFDFGSDLPKYFVAISAKPFVQKFLKDRRLTDFRGFRLEKSYYQNRTPTFLLPVSECRFNIDEP